MGLERSTITAVALLALIAAGCGSGGGGAYTPPPPPTAITFSVSGRISDATSPSPIPGATVNVSAAGQVLGSTTTNSAGDYGLPNLTTTYANVTWSVAAPTYRSFNTSLDVSGGGAFTVNYAMARQIGSVSGTVAAAPTALGLARTSPGPTVALSPKRALPVYAPDRLLVKVKANVQQAAIAALHQQVGGRVLKTIPRLNVQVIRLNAGLSSGAAMTQYRSSGLVDYVEQDVYAYSLAIPNDQFYFAQWHYPAVNLPSAWDTTTGSAAVIVAVVDSGIRSHPDLNGITVQGRDTFDDDNDPTDPGCSTDPNAISHGMHVAGTIAALTNNSIGLAGVNWGGVAGTKIMPIRTLGELLGVCGTGLFSDIADGIVYAADHGAKVINLSLGSSVGTATLQSAVNYASGIGVTLVAAAGNENGSVLFPAAYPNVIAVAATACNNAKAWYSNFGPEVDVAAPGGDNTVTCAGDSNTNWIWSPSWSPSVGNAYFGTIGTSMAAPHVAGIVALMVSRGIVGPSNIQTVLQNTATDLGSAGRDGIFGYGLVNAAAAVGGGSVTARLRAFSGDVSGSTLSIRSDVVEVSSSGSFQITNAHAGIRTVFAWQDFNGNGVVDTGDYFGQTGGVVINDGVQTSGVGVTVQRYSGGAISIQNVLSVSRVR